MQVSGLVSVLPVSSPGGGGCRRYLVASLHNSHQHSSIALSFTPKAKDDIFNRNNRRHVGQQSTYCRQEADFTPHIFRMSLLKSCSSITSTTYRVRATSTSIKMIIVNVFLVIAPLITRVISTNVPMGPLKVKRQQRNGPPWSTGRQAAGL